MKVWSKTLTRVDIDMAAGQVNADFPGCAVYVDGERLALHTGPRTRRFDHLSLCSNTSTRYRNPGTTSFENRYRFYASANAASWTEWGWFLARLFDMDPDARANDYRGRDDFHAATNGRFLEPRSARELQVVRYLHRERDRA